MKQPSSGSVIHGSGMPLRTPAQRPLHLLLAFFTGVLATCVCTLLAARLPALSFQQLIARMEGVAVGPGHRHPCAVQTAPGIALSPQYLAQAANNQSVDILIVAARHEQVSFLLAACSRREHSPAARFATAFQHCLCVIAHGARTVLRHTILQLTHRVQCSMHSCA